MEKLKAELYSDILNHQWKEACILMDRFEDLLKQILSKDCVLVNYAIANNAPADIMTKLFASANIKLQDEDGYTGCCRLMGEKRWDLLQSLLHHEADVNIRESLKQPLLVLSVRSCAPKDIITQFLSPHSITTQHKNDYTVLHSALQRGRWDLVPVLLQHGADVNLCDRVNQTPLHKAARGGAPVDIITQVISSQNKNMQARNGDTALHNAMWRKRWDVVPVLVQHGADVHLCDKKWIRTPLQDAMIFGVPSDIVKSLISPHNINMQSKLGMTPLHEAVKHKRWNLVPVLQEHGADINLCNKWNGTPLLGAMRVGVPLDIATSLISPYNINMQNYDGVTALQRAVGKDRWDLVPVLLQHGADVNLRDKWTQTPLYLAANHGAPADIIIQLMSPHNINMQHKSGETALQMAVNRRQWRLVPVLLQYGAEQPDQPLLLSLQALCINTIRGHMPVKTDAAYEGLGLPRRLENAAKLKPQADAMVNKGRGEQRTS